MDFSNGFKGYEKAEDLHGQILLCKSAGKKALHLKNMNFNLACRYSENAAREIKKILDREGVSVLSLWTDKNTEPSSVLLLAKIYGAEYIVTDTKDTKEKILSVSDGNFKIITEEEE